MLNSSSALSYFGTDDYCDEAMVCLGRVWWRGGRGESGVLTAEAEFCIPLLSPTSPLKEQDDTTGSWLSWCQPHEKFRGCEIFLRPGSSLRQWPVSLWRCDSLFGRISVPGGKAQAREDQEREYLSQQDASRAELRQISTSAFQRLAAHKVELRDWKNPVLFTFLSWKSGLSFLQYLNKCVPAEDLQ